VEILEREGITPRVWIAPGNTFDATTVALLPEFGIRIICDGYFRFPYACPLPSFLFPADGDRVSEDQVMTSEPPLSSSERGWMMWVPQQLFYFRPAAAGVWTVCYHHNKWTASQMRQFRKDVDDYGANIASLKDVLNTNAPRVSKWSEWLCIHPRLSRFLVRAQLKLWSWYAGQRRVQHTDLDALQLPR